MGLFRCARWGEVKVTGISADVKGGSDDLAESSRLILERMRLGPSTLEDEDAADEFKAIKARSVFFFTATWCGPCNEMKPAYEKIARTYGGASIGFAKVDGKFCFAEETCSSIVSSTLKIDHPVLVFLFSKKSTSILMLRTITTCQRFLHLFFSMVTKKLNASLAPTWLGWKNLFNNLPREDSKT
jgi:thiol-disulfide isomerase/thioredoxin